MSLADGFHDVPPGKVATVVTHLEMHEPAPRRPVPAPHGWRLRLVKEPTLDWYRTLFHDVGSDWLWFSRLHLPDADLQAIITNPDIRIWTLSHGTKDAALLELDFRHPAECELAFFGLAPALIGKGAGRFLMNTAIDEAWSQPITRFHVHTCTLDSSQALGFYRRSGFTPIRQQIEIADDPRLLGLLPRDKAPHIPMLSPE